MSKRIINLAYSILVVFVFLIIFLYLNGHWIPNTKSYQAGNFFFIMLFTSPVLVGIVYLFFNYYLGKPESPSNKLSMSTGIRVARLLLLAPLLFSGALSVFFIGSFLYHLWAYHFVAYGDYGVNDIGLALFLDSAYGLTVILTFAVVLFLWRKTRSSH